MAEGWLGLGLQPRGGEQADIEAPRHPCSTFLQVYDLIRFDRRQLPVSQAYGAVLARGRGRQACSMSHSCAAHHFITVPRTLFAIHHAQVRWEPTKGFHVPDLACRECTTLQDTLQVRDVRCARCGVAGQPAPSSASWLLLAAQPGTAASTTEHFVRHETTPSLRRNLCLLSPTLVHTAAVAGGAAPACGQPRAQHGVQPKPQYLHGCVLSMRGMAGQAPRAAVPPGCSGVQFWA